MTFTKNILFLATSSNANSGGGRTRIVDMAIETQKHQLAPRILCCVSMSQLLVGGKFLVQGKMRLEQDAGCSVYYIPMIPFTRFSWLDQINNWYCGLVISFFCQWLHVKIVYGHGVKAGYLGIIARRIFKQIKVIADIQGVVAEEYMYSAGLKTHDEIARRITECERKTMESSDWLLFVSHAMQEHYEQKMNRKLNNCAIIPCATRKDASFDNERRNSLRQEYGFNDKFIVCYAGSAGEYQLPEQMCRLFKKISEKIPASFFLILSHHREIFERNLKIAEISSDSYKITSVPHNQVFNYLQMGDVGLLLRDNSLVNRVASPTKFAEYCLCGLPVLTTDYVGDFSSMAREFNLGHIVDLDNLEIDKSLFSFLADVQNKRIEYAVHCSMFAREHLTWDTYSPELVKIFSNFLLL